jgi:hypothetical protein
MYHHRLTHHERLHGLSAGFWQGTAVVNELRVSFNKKKSIPLSISEFLSEYMKLYGCITFVQVIPRFGVFPDKFVKSRTVCLFNAVIHIYSRQLVLRTHIQQYFVTVTKIKSSEGIPCCYRVPNMCHKHTEPHRLIIFSNSKNTKTQQITAFGKYTGTKNTLCPTDNDT